MNIRQATVEDAELLARLTVPVQQLHAEAEPDMFKPAEVTNELVKFYAEQLSKDDVYTYIAELNGEAVGYVLAKLVERPDNPFTFAMEHMEIDQISLDPAYRSRGYGEQLVKTVFDLARSLGIVRVVLSAWEFNTHARDFFQKQGFHTYVHRMHTRVST